MPLILSLLACSLADTGLTLPSKEGAYDGPLKNGLRMKFRERQPILPGSDSRPPIPEMAIRPEQCDDLTEGGPNRGPDCVTDTIECGETIIGHTIGGVQRFDSKFYEKQFCTPFTTNHDGGDERVYRLRMPSGDYTAFVYLDTPCADLDMAALRWTEDTCPTNRSLISQCDMWPDAYSANREHVQLVSQNESTWLIIVEGKGDAEGPFALHVQCRPGLH